MASAPERISIKRRRVDEPVDHLLYQSKKQRTSNHIFVRISAEKAISPQQITARAVVPTQPVSHLTGPSIPIVKPTQPGDEIKDFQKYRVAQGLQKAPDLSTQGLQLSLATNEPQNLRKFHLTRDLSTTVRPHSSNSTGKIKSTIRPHLPTFVEKHWTNLNTVSEEVKPPIDRIVQSTEASSGDPSLQPTWPSKTDLRRNEIPTFKKPIQTVKKTGRSIHDDPTTWDIESDQLANELAALAFEMDPDALPSHTDLNQSSFGEIRDDVMLVDDPNEYVYETYVRLERGIMDAVTLDDQSNSFGYLVIDEEHEDLWEQYLREDDDDDDEWDEEDEDSNAEDNPRNEYPDEELSSDDERGTNIYRYRRHKSEDEQFDEDEG